MHLPLNQKETDCGLGHFLGLYVTNVLYSLAMDLNEHQICCKAPFVRMLQQGNAWQAGHLLGLHDKCSVVRPVYRWDQ